MFVHQSPILCIAELEVVDEEVHKLVEIGFPALKLSRAEDMKLKAEVFAKQKKDDQMEKAARLDQCRFAHFWFSMTFLMCTVILVDVNLDAIRDEWLRTNGQSQIKTIATHYGIYEHLFGYGIFTPRIPLDIKVSNSFGFEFSNSFDSTVVRR